MRRVSPIHPKSRQTMKQKKTSKTDYDGDGRAKLGYCQRSQAINRSRFFLRCFSTVWPDFDTKTRKRTQSEFDLITYENWFFANACKRTQNQFLRLEIRCSIRLSYGRNWRRQYVAEPHRKSSGNCCPPSPRQRRTREALNHLKRCYQD
jgi:hypothetical protein